MPALTASTSRRPVHIIPQCYNCVDRHVKDGNGDRVCFYWEGNDVDQQTTTTYKQLHDQVCQVCGAARRGASPTAACSLRARLPVLLPGAVLPSRRPPPPPADCQLHEEQGCGQGRQHHHLHAYGPGAACHHGACGRHPLPGIQLPISAPHLNRTAGRLLGRTPRSQPPSPLLAWPTAHTHTLTCPSLPPSPQLACARLGAVFSVVFAGFSAESLAGRISDSSPKMVVTCSAVKRGPKHIELKKIVDEVGPGLGFAVVVVAVVVDVVVGGGIRALLPGAQLHSTPFGLPHPTFHPRRHLPASRPPLPAPCPLPSPPRPAPQALQILDNEEEVHVPTVLIYDHKASGVSREAIHASLVEGRDVWWQDVIPDQPTECEVEWVGAEDPLFKVR